MNDERITDEMVEKACQASYATWPASPEDAMRAALEAALPFLLAEKDAEIERLEGCQRDWMLACDIDGCSSMYAAHEDLRGLRTAGEAVARKRAAIEGWSYSLRDGDQCAHHVDLAERDALRAKVAAVEAVVADPEWFEVGGARDFWQEVERVSAALDTEPTP